MATTALATFDDSPFFEKALRYGVEREIISPDRLRSIQEDLSKGMVQIANYFGTAHLRPELELALQRMVKLISLFLEECCDGDLQRAATSLRDKTLLSHSKGGSDMLKRLHALPESTVIDGESVSPESQRAYLDEKTLIDSFSLEHYRAEHLIRQGNQTTIDFSLWLARKMGVSRADVEEADALIRTAMLVLFVDQAELKIPSRTGFVRLIKAAKSVKAKLDESRLNTFLRNEPVDFQTLAKRAMQRFIDKDLPQIRAAGSTADKLLYADYGQSYFVSESLDEDVREYDRLVAKDWDRVTRGEADDPAVVATVFLLVATGQPGKASMLLKDAKEVTRIFRTSGFDSPAVIRFINAYAPEATREDLQKFWLDDLQTEAEERLADLDANWPDTHMERAVEYLRTTCVANWKKKSR
ncbi:MAG: hypothetical protein WCK63_13045 [Betaproteobacteria bacterium]